jgi:hypothetical protein
VVCLPWLSHLLLRWLDPVRGRGVGRRNADPLRHRPTLPDICRRDVLGIGLLFIVLGLSSIVFPAKTADRLADGSFRFSARRLTLDVAPGELVFVLQFPMDGNRLLPMRVEARRGKVWLTPQLNEINTLFNELAAQNPSAIIDSPLPQWLSRSRRV